MKLWGFSETLVLLVHGEQEMFQSKDELLWFNFSHQPSTTQLLAFTPPQWEEGENWKGKSEKTCGLR